jgi:hypothetical protein
MKNFGTIAATTFVRPLDFVTGSCVAYSDWLLRSAYTSYAFEARRSSDNATTNVAFDHSGVVSNSSVVSAGGNFGTWRGADTIYYRTRYDQSGNGNNVTQTTLANQPIFTDNSYLGRPAMRIASPRVMTGTNTSLKSINSVSIYSRMYCDNGAGSNGFFEAGDGTSLTGIFSSCSNKARFLYRSPYFNSGGDDINTANGTIPTATYFNYTGVRDSSANNQKVWVNGGSVATLSSLTQPALPATNPTVTLGGLVRANNMTGYLFAVIVFPYALTTQQQTYLQTNV